MLAVHSCQREDFFLKCSLPFPLKSCLLPGWRFDYVNDEHWPLFPPSHHRVDQVFLRLFRLSSLYWIPTVKWPNIISESSLKQYLYVKCLWHLPVFVCKIYSSVPFVTRTVHHRRTADLEACSGCSDLKLNSALACHPSNERPSR